MTADPASIAPPAPRIRVLHLDHTTTTGGAEFALVRMLRADAPWVPVVLVPPVGRGVFDGLEESARVLEHGVVQPAGVSAGGFREIVGATARLLAQATATRAHRAFRSADVVDANTSRSGAYGALASLTSRTPFVVHLRDSVDEESLGRVGHAIASRLVLPRADGVVANSHATLATATPFVKPRTLTAVIPSAAGVTRGARRVARAAGPVRIGMLARIDPWKGQDLLIDAFASAFAHGGARLELAGGAPFGHESHLAALRERARERGVGDRVRFLGHVEDVPSLLAGWDIAVQASVRPEPLGQNVLQYLAAGCATVVSDEGGPTEWVTPEVNGLRVAPRDAVALSAALVRLVEDPALRDRLGAAATSTPGLMTDHDVALAHDDFYRRVVAAAR